MSRKIRIGALISGGGTNLQAIIDACETGNINGEVVFVGSDRAEAPGLERATRHGIPSFSVDYRAIIRRLKADPTSMSPPAGFDMGEVLSRQTIFAPVEGERAKGFFLSRAIAEAELLERMNRYEFDLLALAGFMRTLTPYFIDRVNRDSDLPRIINIHPSLLPAFPGTDGYGDTFRYGCKIGGCTVHFIDYGEDTGPIIGQRSFPITSEDTLESVREKGLTEEWELYPECIRLFAENRLEFAATEYTRSDGRRVRRTIVNIRNTSA